MRLSILFILMGILGIFADVHIYQFIDALPRGTFEAEVLEKRLPEKMQRIYKKMEASLLANKEWFDSYLVQYEGKQAPYHRNFGITESEYQLIGKRVTKEVHVVDTVTLSIEYIDFKEIRIIIDSSFFVTDTLHFDINDSTITTRWGSTEYGSWRKRIGPAPLYYTGHIWRSTQTSPITIAEGLQQDVAAGDTLMTSFQAGTLIDSDYHYLHFSVSHYGKDRYGAIEVYRLRYKKENRE